MAGVAHRVALAAVLVATSCHTSGTASTRIGAVCHRRSDCDELCWESTCTLACQTTGDCPMGMSCISGGACAFTCRRRGDRACGGWACQEAVRRDDQAKILVCVPNVGGSDPNNIDENPPDQPAPTPPGS